MLFAARTLLVVCILSVSFTDSAVAGQDDVSKSSYWSREKVQKLRKRQKTSFFYAGLGFTMSGMAFRMENGAVLSNGFLSDGALLGDVFRLGYEYVGSVGYVAIEAFTSSVFSTNSNGMIGQTSTGEGISLDAFGHGTIFAGVNFKPGFAFHSKKGAFYLIMGAAYQWLIGKYDMGGSSIDFEMSGFGLNYGLGVKYSVHSFVMLFLEFTAIAPIQGAGAVGLDRTAINLSTGSPLSEINVTENYALNLGIDFRV